MKKSQNDRRPPTSGVQMPVRERQCCIVFCLAGTKQGVSLHAMTRVCFMLVSKSNPADPKMKIALIAAAAVLLAASCCPNAAPAPGKPVYVAPTK
jgi:hypothetical protein